ncbi:hypothetical protein EDD37DRAFT_502353 [Exophiala viscosa]|uniref:uncharacterized protein n=1 Tax=Exophiala viscosa TaxID=2486360 RepID=UPI00219E08F3|nr:hypothetical protein EDD37DRAFT_502353 [Exophiala viscosa]
MTSAPEPDETPLQFEPADRISIADISPSLTNTSSYILANVALVWPYSSSTGTLALLLADPDIRARKSKGQVKVIFRDGSAREVAKTKVGIGDEVRLRLVGCEWEETGETISTPGKKIDWDLRYRNRVVLRVSREDNQIAGVDYTSVDTEQPPTNGVFEALRSAQDVGPQLNGVVHHEPSTIRVPLLTPSKSARNPSGGSFFDVPQDPSAEDDGYVHGRGRKRTKFARHSGAWSLVDAEDEPTPQDPVAEAEPNGASTPVDQPSERQVIDLSSDPVEQEQEASQHVAPDASAAERSAIDRQGSATQESAEDAYHTAQAHDTEAGTRTEKQNTTPDPIVVGDNLSVSTENEDIQEHRAEEELLVDESGRTKEHFGAEGGHAAEDHPQQDILYHSEAEPSLPPRTPVTVSLVGEQEVDDLGLSHPTEPPDQMLEAPPAIMGPPQTPLRLGMLRTQSAGNVSEYSEPASDATTTPRLHPLASPGLPLVSPLVQRSGVDVGYFPLYQDDASQLDASGAGRDADIIGVRRDIFEHGASEVIRNAGLNIRMEDEEVTPQTATAHISSPSDESVVFVQDTTTETPISPQADAQASMENNSPDSSHAQQPVPVQEPDIQPTARLDDQQYESTITEQWLSSTELAIDRELYEREEPPHLNIAAQAAEAVEIEDDDLYGPPPESASNLASPMVQDMQPQLISPLDVVEQFLQIASTEEFASDPAAHVVEDQNEQPQDRPPASDGPDTNWQEKITVGAVECNSPGTYPAPPFPFQQKWHKPKTSRTSSRRSSAIYTPIPSLDGNVDERETFPAAEESISELIEEELLPAVESRPTLQSADADSPMQDVDTTGEDVVHGDMKETEEIRSIEERPEQAEPHFAAVDVDMLEAEDAAHEVVLVDTTEIEAIAIAEERQAISSQDDLIHVVPTPHSPHLTDTAAIQLPTPDDTQDEQYPRDRDQDHEPVQEQGAVSPGLPSPLPTQRDAAAVEVEEVAQVHAEAEVATPVTATTHIQVHPETSAARRTSQRLSSRRSIMSNNISSPYFTPRKAPRAASSSPTRKENINPSTPRLSSPIPSSSRGGTKSPLPLQPIEEQEYGTILAGQRGVTDTSNVPLKREGSGITTPLAYHPYLESLHEHFGQLVDVIGVSVEHSSGPERSKLGPKDYFTSLRLADSSVQSAFTVQIFRPSKSALPVAQRGDAVLLRNFKVQTLNRTFMLVSNEASSWAVFQPDANASSSWSKVVVAGPPVEYGHGETDTVSSLLSWWAAEGEKHSGPPDVENALDETHMVNGVSNSPSPKRKPTPRTRRKANIADNVGDEKEQVIEDDDVEMTTQPVTETNDLESPMTKPPPSIRRRDNMTDNFGNDGGMSDVLEEDEAEAGETNPPAPTISDRRGSTISIASSAVKLAGKASTPRRSARHRRSQSVVHELRDGTKYVDDDRRRSGSVVHELRDGATYVDE